MNSWNQHIKFHTRQEEKNREGEINKLPAADLFVVDAVHVVCLQRRDIAMVNKEGRKTYRSALCCDQPTMRRICIAVVEATGWCRRGLDRGKDEGLQELSRRSESRRRGHRNI